MKVANIDFKEAIVLAPMAGVTDIGFRKEASIFLADACFSEMLSAAALIRNPQKTMALAQKTNSEKVSIAQLFGNDPKVFELAMNHEILKIFDGIDINMGCPAPKIVKNGEGSALMKDIKKASLIIRHARKVCNKSLSVKFRKGFERENCVDFARMCYNEGVDFITIHGRLAKEGYSGKCDYDAIAKVKSSTPLKVFGSGDVVDYKTYGIMKSTGVDGVMIGRGALGRPWIFSEIKSQIDCDEKFLAQEKIQNLDRFMVINQHIQTLRAYYDEKFLTKYIRKHLLWYVKGQEFPSEDKQKIATSSSIDSSLQIIKKFYAK